MTGQELQDIVNAEFGELNLDIVYVGRVNDGQVNMAFDRAAKVITARFGSKISNLQNLGLRNLTS